MITVTSIIGSASDPRIADRLHDLEHQKRVEVLTIDRDDALRRRLRGKTDKGTEVALALERSEQLSDGAVLLLDEARAILVRVTEEHWLEIKPRDADAALEAGYCAGNHHWRVRFAPGRLLVAMQGPAKHYVDRLEHLLKSGQIEVSSND